MRIAMIWLTVTATLALAACGEKPPNTQASDPAPALPTAPGLALSDARVQLPVVAGRPGAAYFTLSQSSGAPRKLVSATVEMAGRAEMHETMAKGTMSSMQPLKDLTIESGHTIKFEPGGKHLMLFDLDPKLRFQKDVALTLAFNNGDKVGTRAAVTTAGDGMEHPH